MEGQEARLQTIGVLFGQENSFPGALVDHINRQEIEGIRAEFVQVGGVVMAEPCPYAVIVDRISHEVPFYRSYLKNAVLTGTQVINNPFWWSADDKFFNYALASKLGVAVPRTVILPHKLFPPNINSQSLRNLEFPLNWEAVFDYVKFPAFLKPHDGGGWRDVHHVRNATEFFHAYDQTRDLAMTLQAAVNFNEYFRCYVIGQEHVRIMPYDPRQPHERRYVQDPPEYAPELLKRVEEDCLKLCRALGYDLNTVEFAVEDGVPYAIDFMNPAPDADYHSVGAANFTWVVEKVAELAIRKARSPVPQSQGLHWSRFLSGGAMDLSSSATAKEASPDPTRKALEEKAAAKRANKAAVKKAATRKS